MAFGEGKSGANPGPTTQYLVGQGPCALPGVRYGIGGRTGASGPTEGYEGCNGRATARVAPTKCCDECVGWVSVLAEVF